MNITAREAARKQQIRFEARALDPKEIWGIPWGIEKLDHITHGIKRKEIIKGEKVGDNDLIVLIADTGVGKSSWAGWIAHNVAEYFKQYEPDKEVRLITLEMSAEQFQERMASAKSGVPLERITTGMFLTDDQQLSYYDAVSDLAELPIRYIDSLDNLADLGRSITSKIDGKTCGLWVLDHLHLAPGASNADNSVGALNEVVVGLTKLATHTSPGIVLTQMNKDSLRRVDKRPQKSDIRNNTSLSNAATVIMGLYREDIYVNLAVEEKPKVVPAELTILKNRSGKMGLIELDLMTDRMMWGVK